MSAGAEHLLRLPYRHHCENLTAWGRPHCTYAIDPGRPAACL